ncbi:SDR family oxidoreductase [Rathayibacter agropyri]
MVAGGSRGIGGEIAFRLATTGDTVVVGCREKVARAQRLSERAIASGGCPISVRGGDLRDPAARAELIAKLGRIDVLVLAASGGMEADSREDEALALNRDALVALVEEALPRMGVGSVIVYLTSHQAHFSREVAPEPEYATVAASKRAGEDAILMLADRIGASDSRLVVVSADVIVDSATTLLMDRLRPGSTAERLAEIGELPTTADVADTVIDAIDRERPNASVVFHGDTAWFKERARDLRLTDCSVIRMVDGGTRCASVAVPQIVASLRQCGVKPVDRVLVCDESNPETALLLLALFTLGVSVVLLDQGTPDAEIARIASRAECTVTVTRRHLPSVEGRRDLGSTGELAGAIDSTCDGMCPPATCATFAEWSARHDALVLWTSGSSGRPRGVVRSGSSVLDNVRVTARAMAYRRDDVLLPLLPISHQYGLSLVIIWWLVGCTLVLGNHRRPVQTFLAASALGPTIVDAAPPVMEDLLRLVETRGLDSVAPRVRMWCVGGSPLRSSLALRFHEVTGRALLDGYGSTELGNISLATLNRPEGLGDLLPGIELSIRRPDSSSCRDDEAGEIWIRSRYTFTATIDDLRPAEFEDGWYRTGDVGLIGANKEFRVIGRLDAVHRGGFTVYSSSIEDRADAAGIPLTVVAIPDDRRGAHLTAFVENGSTDTRSEWTDRIRDALPEHEWPNRVVVLPALPRLDNGKIDRARLTADAEAGRSMVRARSLCR